MGRLAQLVEHLLYTQGVAGSSPAPPTRNALLDRAGSDGVLETLRRIEADVADLKSRVGYGSRQTSCLPEGAAQLGGPFLFDLIRRLE